MTTTDPGWIPPAPPDQPTSRVLRRSRTERVGAGVAGGLGEYFGVDPVLFRVLFATSAFFGGAGVLAYLLAWAAIPEAGTTHAAIDRWAVELRRRRVPFWGLAVVAGLVLWAVAFSWWAPGPFLPVMAVVIVLVAVFARNGRRSAAVPTAEAADRNASTVNLHKEDGTRGASTSPEWVHQTRQWIVESKQASRLRRRRALPVKLATLVTLVLTLAVLGLVDAVSGIAVSGYFWATFGIVLLGLLTGIVLRRTPWSITSLLVPALAGVIAFAGTHASLHDGSGSKEWTPTTIPAAQYRLAFGQGVLDLRHLAPLDAARTIDVTAAAGQVKVLLPRSLNATVNAHVHIGQIEHVDIGQAVVIGQQVSAGPDYRRSGFDINHVMLPPTGATGPALTINVHLADGDIDVEES